MAHRQRTKRRRWLIARHMVHRVRRLGTAFCVAFLAASISVWALERHVENTHVETLLDAIWLSICTISTVGYGDTFPVTTAGRVIVGLFIMFTMISIGFLLTAINEAVIEVKAMEEKGLIGTDFKDHIIVCGFSHVARTAIEELLSANRDVAVICDQEEDLPLARRYASRGNIFCTSGDLDQDVLRERLNAELATTAVVATNEDTVNIIAALNLRAVNPKIRVVVAVKTEALRQTLIASGVTYVASPFELSGRLVASAAFEPEVARFVDDITSGIAGFDLQQYSAEPFQGLTIREVRQQLIDINGPLLVGVATWRDDHYELLPHPPQDLEVHTKDQLIVVANEAHACRIVEKYDLRQGR